MLGHLVRTRGPQVLVVTASESALCSEGKGREMGMLPERQPWARGRSPCKLREENTAQGFIVIQTSPM